MAPAARVEKAGRLAHVVYLYELWTGLYMLDAWEKAFFSACGRRGVGVGCIRRSARRGVRRESAAASRPTHRPSMHTLT